MITWDDIPSIADRSMQEALRNVESGKLAVALYGASDAIVEKIRSNISERAVASLDEEISLMQDPIEKEVLDAREEVVNPLREANEQGTLRMIGR
jgi:flagellar motor switch protein FliG